MKKIHAKTLVTSGGVVIQTWQSDTTKLCMLMMRSRFSRNLKCFARTSSRKLLRSPSRPASTMDSLSASRAPDWPAYSHDNDAVCTKWSHYTKIKTKMKRDNQYLPSVVHSKRAHNQPKVSMCSFFLFEDARGCTCMHPSLEFVASWCREDVVAFVSSHQHQQMLRARDMLQLEPNLLMESSSGQGLGGSFQDPLSTTRSRHPPSPPLLFIFSCSQFFWCLSLTSSPLLSPTPTPTRNASCYASVQHSSGVTSRTF